MKTISNEPVIESGYLGSLVKETDKLTIDLTPTPLNTHGFRVTPKEERCVLSHDAIVANEDKLENECDPLTVRKGSEWGDGKAPIRLPQRRQIVIRG